MCKIFWYSGPNWNFPPRAFLLAFIRLRYILWSISVPLAYPFTQIQNFWSINPFSTAYFSNITGSSVLITYIGYHVFSSYLSQFNKHNNLTNYSRWMVSVTSNGVICPSHNSFLIIFGTMSNISLYYIPAVWPLIF